MFIVKNALNKTYAYSGFFKPSGFSSATVSAEAMSKSSFFLFSMNFFVYSINFDNSSLPNSKVSAEKSWLADSSSSSDYSFTTLDF